MPSFVVGAYASLPQGREAQETYYDLLGEQPWIEGTELPFPGDLADTADRIWLFEKERGEKKEEEERKEEVKEEEEGKEEEEEKKTNGDKMSKIISGTPQELVSNGSISRFAKGA